MHRVENRQDSRRIAAATAKPRCNRNPLLSFIVQHGSTPASSANFAAALQQMLASPVGTSELSDTMDIPAFPHNSTSTWSQGLSSG